ncbi:MAG: hypothetical protein JXA18_02965 [Chitinispirillaceae bacterium]|nr:hypothetical protein [Chitinispirillaceae bacterium]
MSSSMWVLNFYRFYMATAVGIGAALLFVRTWWFGLAATVVARICYAAGEHFIARLSVARLFKQHAYAFKQQLGPYGIRMINKAEKDAVVRKSLAEVFTNNEKKLRRAIESLEMMDILFRAGMRPDGDAYQLHDLKLKYGRFRIEQLEKRARAVQPQGGGEKTPDATEKTGGSALLS